MIKFTPEKTPLWCSCRLNLALMGFLGFANMYALRAHLSVALVCMLNHTAIDRLEAKNETQAVPGCSANGKNISDEQSTNDGEFIWLAETQGIVLGSFFWGYIATQIVGGILAERIGGKRVLTYSLLLSAISTLLCPIGVKAHYIWLIALRVVCGLGQGAVYPAFHSIWSHWAPSSERTILVGLSYAGVGIGNVIAFPISGLMCDFIGWESVFYLFGSLGVIWCILWSILVSDTPALHPRITEKERIYIEKTVAGKLWQETKDSVPWVEMAKSGPVWAIIVAHTTDCFASYLFLTKLPTYMAKVLSFDIRSNGLYSALPFLAYFIVSQFATTSADFLRNHHLSTKNVRRIMVVNSNVGISLFIVITGYLNCDFKILAVIMLTLGQGMEGFLYAGYLVNHIDIAPRYAGILMGISNTFATISGILAPYIASVLTEEDTFAEWRVVFWISAAILVFGATFFVIFCDGEVQDWALAMKNRENIAEDAVMLQEKVQKVP